MKRYNQKGAKLFNQQPMLPSRAALTQLTKSNHTLADYSKVNPMEMYPPPVHPEQAVQHLQKGVK